MGMVSEPMQEVIAQLWELNAARASAPAPTLEESRAAFESRADQYPVDVDVTVTEVEVAGRCALWLDPPEADPGRIVLFLHGGGYAIGSPRADGELASRIGRSTGARVLSLDYRLAPEHPYPAAVEDAVAAWHWLADEHHVDPASVAVAGESAGGGLTLAMMLALRDAEESLPAAAGLISPWTDVGGTLPTLESPVLPDPIFAPETIRGLGTQYLAGADPRDPLASPVFADLSGLPPLWIVAGSAEVLLSDSEELARAAVRAGVDVHLEVAAGLTHVFPAYAQTPEARAATDRLGAFLRSWVDLV